MHILRGGLSVHGFDFRNEQGLDRVFGVPKTEIAMLNEYVNRSVFNGMEGISRLVENLEKALNDALLSPFHKAFIEAVVCRHVTGLTANQIKSLWGSLRRAVRQIALMAGQLYPPDARWGEWCLAPVRSLGTLFAFSLDRLCTEWYNATSMDNRTNILFQALNLFAARGYEGVGVQEIVDAAASRSPRSITISGAKRAC